MLVWFQKLINGTFLLLRREMRQQIPFDITGRIPCTYMYVQSTRQHISGNKTNEMKSLK